MLISALFLSSKSLFLFYNKDMTIKNFIVQNGEDDDILHQKLFDVNMRLFNNNKKYRRLILNVVHYMEKVAKKKFKDYTTAKGISGANVGIPFNIIGIKNGRKWNFFLNPACVKKSRKKRITKSNCGSLCLKAPIKIKRRVWIEVEYYDLKGKKETRRFDGCYGYTVQHEIDHNNGVLIISKKRRA